MKKVLVIIPTYNEADNIILLLEDIFIVFEKFREQYLLQILIADDNSSDGTTGLVKNLSKSYPNLTLITGNKEGLGKAYLRAINHSLKNFSFDYLVMMDGDLSHKPKYIPLMLEQLDAGADYVIGSRYTPGGSVSSQWSRIRFLQSILANGLARFLIDRKTSVRDLTGGFKVMRKTCLQRIPINDFTGSGYVFQVFLFYQFLKLGYSIKEVPIKFSERGQGKSKLRLKDIWEFVFVAYQLNPEARLQQFIRFGVVGAIGVVVNVVILVLLVNFTSLPVLICYLLALEASIVSNFFMNHLYTFKTRRRKSISSTSIVGKLLRYNAIAAGGAAISIIVFWVAYRELGIYYVAADLLAITVAMAWNYWLSTKVVWPILSK